MSNDNVLPLVLKNLVGQSQNMVSTHPQYALMPFSRRRIYQAIDLLPNSALMRKWLEYLTAVHVLPIWEAARPADSTMSDLLELSRRYLEGEVSRDILEAAANKAAQTLRTDTQEVQVASGGVNAHMQETLVPRRVTHEAHTYALLAAIEVLFRLLEGYRVTWDKIKLQEDHTDAVLNSRNSDTAFYAVSAYANGPVWLETSSDRKRLQFWQWWLDEAIPQAWIISK